MALATDAVPTLIPRPSWNPLRCGGTGLPPNLLLMAKLIALALLLTNHVGLLPDPFLPFIPGLDRLGPPWVFQRILQIVFVGSAIMLLFNCWVRASSLALGATMLLAVVASRAYYGNNKTFCGLMLVLAGLHQPGRKPWFLRWQLAVVYLGAGLNKLLDPDWQSGHFFQNWAANRLHQSWYLALEPWLPPMLLAKLMSWATILMELGLVAGFLVPRLYFWGIWGNILLQSAMLLFTGSTFTMFFYAMTASMLAFVDWPKTRLKVIYDADCGFCNRTREWFKRFDFDGIYDWTPYQSGVGEAHGISILAAQQALHLVTEKKIYKGFHAFQIMLLYNPVFYFTITAAIAVAPASATLFRRIFVAILLGLFLPPFRPIGEAVYGVVARNRNKLVANANCKV